MGEEVVKNSKKRDDVLTLWTAPMYVHLHIFMRELRLSDNLSV